MIGMCERRKREDERDPEGHGHRTISSATPIDHVIDSRIEDEAFTYVGVFGMSEPDVALALKQPWVSVCNDSQGTALDGVLGKEHPHQFANAAVQWEYKDATIQVRPYK